MTGRINNEQLDTWIAALRSGKYSQGGGMLKRVGDRGTFYCCLGVLCETLGLPSTPKGRGDEDGAQYFMDPDYCGRSTAYIPSGTGELLFGVDNTASNPRVYCEGKLHNLTYLNDDALLSFPQIADVLEANRKWLTLGERD